MGERELLGVFTNPLNEMDLEIEWWHETVISSNLRVLHATRVIWESRRLPTLPDNATPSSFPTSPLSHRATQYLHFSLPRELGTDGVGLGARIACRRKMQILQFMPCSAFLGPNESKGGEGVRQ